VATTSKTHVFTYVPENAFTARDSQSHVFGKAIPLQAWTGPEGSRSLRLPDFETIGT
jgi:hypothetical protein